MRNSNYYLATSSTFFLGPALYGFYKGHRILPTASLLSTIVSINYWLDPLNIQKKILDQVVTRSIGIIYLYYGYNNVQGPLRIVGYANISMILTMYQASCILYNLPTYSYLWIPCHITFHYITSLGQLLVLSYK
jgi:hypothetical protein